jgi:hypothetical protein
LYKAELYFGDFLEENMDISEMIFDCSACYFPITFAPPPDDPFGIKPESLVTSLEDCLCTGSLIIATRHTAAFAVTQIESDSMVGRAHALNLLSRIVREYGHTASL